MDIFEQWLANRNESEWIKRALTDRSYNNYRCKGIKQNHPKFTELHTPLPINADMATYGDAVIKLCYLEILLDHTDKLTEVKSGFESDDFLVDRVARHYDLLKFIIKDPEDEKLPDSYDYLHYGGTNKNPCKYIATCVEAIIAAIYIETKNLSPIIELLKKWMTF